MANLKPLMLGVNRTSTDLTHGLFRFPGRFHPPLVTHLIGLHPEATIIGDPMVGSGTVAVEAAAFGRGGLYSDIDPLSCLLTRAKSRPVNPTWLLKAIQAIIAKTQPFATLSIGSHVARECIADLEGSTPFKAPPDVFHWFEPYIVVNMCKVLQGLAEIECSSRRRDALLAVFAATIRRISRADPRTSSGLEVTKVRLKALRRGLTFDLAGLLIQKTNLLAMGYRGIRKTSGVVKVEVVNHDARDWSALCAGQNIWPELVITSPCYISAIEYWRRHKLEYTWLGLIAPDDLTNVKHTFLGMGHQEPEVDRLPSYARRLYTKLRRMDRKQDANTLARYFNDSSKWLAEVLTVLDRTDGTAYVIVGSNTNHGLTINTPLALQEIAAGLSLTTSVFMRYRIKNSYMQYPTKGKRIRVETVLRIKTNS